MPARHFSGRATMQGSLAPREHSVFRMSLLLQANSPARFGYLRARRASAILSAKSMWAWEEKTMRANDTVAPTPGGLPGQGQPIA